MDSVLVGFGYKARCGKDAAIAAILAARAGEGPGKYDVRRYAFADALKREANEAAIAAGSMEKLFQLGGVFEGVTDCTGQWTPFPSWVQYDPNAPMDDPLCPLGKQRTLLQWWGTEYRRARDNNYWVRKLQATIEAEKPRIALIADCRFPNEISWVKSDPSSGFVCRVDRLGFKGIGSTHPSETMLDWMAEEDWHYILQVPDGQLEELQRDAVVLFDLIVDSLTPPDLSEFQGFEETLVVKEGVKVRVEA